MPCKADLEQRTADVPEENKPAVYTGAVTFNGRHGFPFTYVNFPPFLAVHANNVADEFLESVTGEALQTAQESGTAYVGQNGFEVDLEQILQWDPDIIFLDPSNMDLVNDEYRSNPGFFDSLRAVQEGQVYTMPSSNSAGPNITYLLINAYYAELCSIPTALPMWISGKRAARLWRPCWDRISSTRWRLEAFITVPLR